MAEEEKQEEILTPDAVEKVNETTLVEWDALEFSLRTKNLFYYLGVGLVVLSVIAFSAYTKDWFIIAISLLVGGFLFWYPSIKPNKVHYRITQLGIYVNDHFYPYTEINSFWLFLNQKENKLNIIFNKKYLPQLSLLIPEVDPLKLKMVLAKYIPEQEGRTESLVDKVTRLLKL